MASVKYKTTDGSWEDVFDPLEAYPIGSIILMYDNTSPAETLGGTWTAIKDDVYLRSRYGMSSNGPGTQGGSWMHQHVTSIGYDRHLGSSASPTQFSWLDADRFPIYGSRVIGGVTQIRLEPQSGNSVVVGDTGRFALTNTESVDPPFLGVAVWRRVS